MIARQGLGSVHGFLSGEFGLHFVLIRFGKRLIDWTGSANQTALLKGNSGSLANFPEADFWLASAFQRSDRIRYFEFCQLIANTETIVLSALPIL